MKTPLKKAYECDIIFDQIPLPLNVVIARERFWSWLDRSRKSQIFIRGPKVGQEESANDK